ncbi:hypothetical protein A9K55_002671 [Cordyceps militaris]|uniref:Uncharacterized protein n=1 Tax=Cordyceps militaris TaxID=73501 RepID=A0A2H4S854_CORMI|nr:hypothetical protein A9K55_002671 [Cordyceps militaris]
MVRPVNTVYQNTMEVSNEIEYFGPAEFPMRRAKTKAQHEVRHAEDINLLRQIRHDLRQCGQGSYSLDDLGKFLRHYNLVVYSSINDAELIYQSECRAIREGFLSQRASGSFFCHLKAKHEARASENALLSKAASAFELEKAELLEAKELMYRQLIMNAFLTCELSWDTQRYAINGVRQGSLSDKPIEGPHLKKDPEDSLGGLYRLQLTWVPAPNATRYPARIYIDRLASGKFATEHIAWRSYDRGDNGWESHPHLAPTVLIEASIRCRHVAGSQRQDRFLAELHAMAEAEYKKSLRPWQRLVYKTGDYQRAYSFPIQPTSIRPQTISTLQ